MGGGVANFFYLQMDNKPPIEQPSKESNHPLNDDEDFCVPCKDNPSSMPLGW
jgi:hypothetical protein